MLTVSPKDRKLLVLLRSGRSGNGLPQMAAEVVVHQGNSALGVEGADSNADGIQDGLEKPLPLLAGGQQVPGLAALRLQLMPLQRKGIGNPGGRDSHRSEDDGQDGAAASMKGAHINLHNVFHSGAHGPSLILPVPVHA